MDVTALTYHCRKFVKDSMEKSWDKSSFLILALGITISLLSNCSTVYKTTGRISRESITFDSLNVQLKAGDKIFVTKKEGGTMDMILTSIEATYLTGTIKMQTFKVPYSLIDSVEIYKIPADRQVVRGVLIASGVALIVYTVVSIGNFSMFGQ